MRDITVSQSIEITSGEIKLCHSNWDNFRWNITVSHSIEITSGDK